MIGPDYRRPTVDTPQDWRFQEQETRELADTLWWEQFDDPVLNDLIKIGLAENKDIKIAAARIEQFAGQYITTRSALFPQIDAGASFGRERASEKGAAPVSSGVENPADAFLAQYPVGSKVKSSSAAWSTISATHTLLDSYNNGLLCAPHRD